MYIPTCDSREEGFRVYTSTYIGAKWHICRGQTSMFWPHKLGTHFMWSWFFSIVFYWKRIIRGFCQDIPIFRGKRRRASKKNWSESMRLLSSGRYVKHRLSFYNTGPPLSASSQFLLITILGINYRRWCDIMLLSTSVNWKPLGHGWPQWPDEFVGKSPKMSPNSFFCQN
jgi:hypothetical protein